ncbi:hypothetical protein [Plastoroseomonas hellenica]|uniref:hypothetical protein n=1 Tax=Plastoroseomonas hellenica TaxID=2687306 RepID=UPI001BAC848F|nr:hypothetical protein [Plastoroseomonas hellenica]
MDARGVILARVGALFYTGWGLFHLHVAWDIMILGLPEGGLVQGRLFQLAAYMLTISLFVIGIAVRMNWRNDRLGYWLNLCVAGWADAVWVAVVVLPGYVGLMRGLVPPAVFVAGAVLTTFARCAVAATAAKKPSRGIDGLIGR